MQLYLTDTNPNDIHGGGGDFSNPIKTTDTAEGPWVVSPAQEFEYSASPVACISYATFLAVKKLFEEGEVLSGGERTEVPDAEVQRESSAGPESPEFNLDDPAEREAFLTALEGEAT